MSVSYAYEVKNEICGCGKFDHACCKKAQLYGIVLFSAVYTKSAFKLTTGHISTALRCVSLINELIGEEIKVKIMGKGYSVKAEGKIAEKLFDFMGHTSRDISLRLNYVNLNCAHCTAAFLSGAFLACGTVTSPDKSYRLEFSSTHADRLEDLKYLLENEKLNFHITNRAGTSVIYTKESECIETLLTLMGATISALQLMNTKVAKNIRNRANRAVNVETANLGRTLASSVKQVEAIEYLMEIDELYNLEPALIDIATLRLANQECSLSQLALLTNASRSLVNSRLKRLVEIADEFKNS